MWFKSSFTIPAVAATSFCLIGGTSPAVTDLLHVPDDWRLMPDSPCIDAADNTAVPKGIDTDFDGNPRFVDDPDSDDTGFGDPPIVNMVAYAFQAVTCPWDLNDNGSVGVFDLLLLLASLGPCKGCPADFDGNGNVDVFDLVTLLGNWGRCP